MKRINLLILVCFYFSLRSNAQSVMPNGKASGCIHSAKFYVSKPMRELPEYKPVAGGAKEEAADKIRRLMHRRNKMLHSINDYTDPIIQTNPGEITAGVAPIVNFKGMSVSVYSPPDPNGAVGPNDYVETINSCYAVYDKSGNVLLTPRDLKSLWTGNQNGDPVVLYDKFADRWFLSEFEDTIAPCQLCVAVSQTNDPTGAYYVWEFNMGNTLPDYPKYSIWPDGYYLTFQAYSFSSQTLITPQQVGVLERNRMLKGDSNAGLILADLPSPPDFAGANNDLCSAPKTFDCDASALPPFGTPNYFVFFENVASGGYSNSIIMYKLATDTTLHTLTVSRADSFAVPTFNAYFTGGTYKNISQPGYPHGTDALDGTFNFRVPYMKFIGYNSVVLSNTVNLGSMVAGIRWYELRQNDTTKIWSIHQEGTYGPNDGISRWNGAICMDYDGNIALEYSVASSAVYPGIRYTGRLNNDSLGQMTIAEQTAINGTSTLSENGHRWGDYSQLDIDPSDGLTFWGINEYGASANSYTQLSRIFSFKLADALGIDAIQNKTEVKVYQNNQFLEVKATGLPGNESLTVDLFDISGRHLTTQSVAPFSNTFETKINVSGLAKGVYLVRIGRANFQKVVKTLIN